MPLASDVPNRDGDFDGTTDLVDPENQPFDGAITRVTDLSRRGLTDCHYGVARSTRSFCLSVLPPIVITTM